MAFIRGVAGQSGGSRVRLLRRPFARDDQTVPFRAEFDDTLLFEAVIAGIVFVVVIGLLGFALLRYRARGPDPASQATEHPRAEAIYAAVLLVVALVVVFVTRGAMAADNRAPTAAPVVVRVTGFQWCWRFDYVGTGVQVTASCLDGHYPTLVLPARRAVRVEVTSRDVIHSFWVPAFRFKMDALPDHLNSFVITVPHPGTWSGHCAEFCGEDHAFMTFQLKAVPLAQYRIWLADRAVRPSPAA